MGIVIDTYHGTYRTAGSGDKYAILRPKTQLVPIPIVCCHGGNDLSDDWIGKSVNITKLATRLAMTGFLVGVHDLGGNTFGNATAMARMDELLTLLGSPAQIFGVGESMGKFTLAQYAAYAVGKVRAVQTVIGGSDIDDIYNNNRNGATALINTAWGAPPVPAAARIHAGSAVMASIVSQGLGARWVDNYSDGDTVVIPQTVTDWCTAAGATANKISTSGGHSDATVASLDATSVAQWFYAHK